MYVDFDTIRYLWPEVILVLIAAWIYLAGTIQPSRAWWTIFSLAAYGVAAAIVLWKEAPFWHSVGQGAIEFASGPIVVDYLGYVGRLFILLLAALFTLASSQSMRRETASEYLGSLMLLVVGLMLVTRANDLVFLFVSLELVSIPTYVLLYLGRRDRPNSEAAIKYFLLSVFSSALFLYGASFLYGFAGTTALVSWEGQPSIQSAVAEAAASSVLIPAALCLLFAGLGFKIAAVPFHFYAADVYQGATSTNAGLLAVAPKVAGVLAMIRLLVVAFPQGAGFAWQLTLVLAILTMTLGNVCALWQRNLRRLLAYSAVAHAGYLLIGVAVGCAGSQLGGTMQGGISGSLFYLFVYALASYGAFITLAYLSTDEHEVENLQELRGLSHTRPLSALVLALFMFSLAGIPPLAGFWGKLTLFLGALNTGLRPPQPSAAFWFVLLAAAGALNAAIAAAYYLRVVAVMYFQSAGDRPPGERRGGAWAAMTACAVLVVVVGIFPKFPLAAAKRCEQSCRQTAVAAEPAAGSAVISQAARP